METSSDPSVVFSDLEEEHIEELSTTEKLSLTEFEPIVQFYRSAPHSNNVFGDESGSDVNVYAGSFGFDSFNKKVHAEGWIKEYKAIHSLEQKDPVVKSYYKYLCAWASIWPPNVPGNMGDGKEKITVWAKALEARTPSQENTGNISFKSSNNNVRINGTNKWTLTIGDNAKPIDVECTAPFSEEVTIDAVNDNNQLVGQLRLYPNHERYITEIQPVKITLGKLSSLTVNSIPHESFMTEMLVGFNQRSYNQAYMQAKLSEETHEIKLDKAEFVYPAYLNLYVNQAGKSVYYLKRNDVDDSDISRFNDLIEERYSKYLVNKGDLQKAFQNYTKAALEFLEKLRKQFRYKGDSIKSAIKMRDRQIASYAWENKEVKMMLANVENKKLIYDELNNGKHLMDKAGKIYVFYSLDIEGATNTTGLNSSSVVGSWIPGYSNTGSGVTFLFNSVFSEKDITGTILHEIGHALGLKHPFEIEGETPPPNVDKLGRELLSKEDYGEQLRKIEKRIDCLKDDKSNSIRIEEFSVREKIPIDEAAYIHTLMHIYKSVNKQLDNVCIYPSQATQTFTFCREAILQTLIPSEKTSGQTSPIKSSFDIQREIDRLEQEKTKTQVLENAASSSPGGYGNSKDQSRTLENYMDYTQSAGSSSHSPDVSRMVFYQWQWKTMIETGKSRGYLILNA